MRVRYIWEESDIIAGVFFTRMNWINNISQCASMTYQVGYDNINYKGKMRFRLISIVDGMICDVKTQEDIAEMFNIDPFGYERTSEEMLVRMIKDQAKRTL